jgi:squalene-hopene/tetraprenyl-beta-curcumene cyclase
MAAGDYKSDSVALGIAFLLEQQRKDGGWFEVPYTGTGFPRVFYLKYTYYYQYFPLLALTKYAKVTKNC